MAQRTSRRRALAIGAAAVGAAAATAAAAVGLERRGGSRSVASHHLRTSHRYGPDAAQVADLWLPATGRPTRTAVLIHGGYWRSGYDRTLEDGVAGDLVASGWAVWNIDYRGTGAGGGWPHTFTDVASALDLFVPVAAQNGLDVAKTAYVGHSAGGALALWAGGRARLPTGAPGAPAAAPALHPRVVVAQAGVDNLVRADAENLGAGAVAALIGGSSSQYPGRYALVDPVQRVPLGVPLLAITGGADTTVPPSQSASFASAATAAGDDVDHVVVPGEDHFAHLEPSSVCWHRARAWLEGHLPG